MWTMKLKDVPKSVNRHAVTIKGKIYSFDISYEERDFIDVYIFHSACYSWDVVRTTPLPGGRPRTFLDLNVVAYGDSAYLLGGWRTKKSDSGGSLYRFDTNTMTWSCPEVSGDEPRILCRSACVIAHRMFIISSQPVHSVRHIHFLDLNTYKWHRVHTTGDAPICPPFNSACVIGSRIYVWECNVYNNSLFYLDTISSTWVRPHVEGVAPELRFSHAVFVYNGEMYIFGGYSRKLRILFADVHKYDPTMSCWTQVRPKRSGPCARVLNASCVIGNRAFVFLGRTSKRIRGGGYPPADRQVVPPHRFDEEELTDMYVLDFAPALQTLCLVALVDARVQVWGLPKILMDLYNAMEDDDSISHRWWLMG
ncbi:kelch domain-containing protein 3-like [Amblyomma americanum]